MIRHEAVGGSIAALGGAAPPADPFSRPWGANLATIQPRRGACRITDTTPT
ncbi:MAG: hypothetical protein ACOYOP_07515 [Microthrixaceae bacterium]